MPISFDSKLKEILADPDAKAILDELIPHLSGHPSMKMALGMKMSKIARLPYSKLKPEKAKELEERLNALGNKGAL